MKYKIDNRVISREILTYLNNNEIIANILARRGYDTLESVRAFYEKESYKPTVWQEFPGMVKAQEITAEAIRLNKKIYIYGDYDCDGVTSTAVLMEGLGRFTKNLHYHVPDRFSEGYGMNIRVIEKMIAEGADLIITCDCGISNVEEIRRAKESGVSVIVTDHHTPPDILPAADVLLNPKFLDKNHKAYSISGCVMAWYLISAVYSFMGVEGEEEELLDLAAISVIADVVPLKGENRYIFQKGREKLASLKRVGIKALSEIGNIVFEGEEDIGFQIAPRINAAGRLDTARKAVDLMLETDYEKAVEQALEIEELNKSRKKIQDDIVYQAVRQVEEGRDSNVNLLYGSEWHHGVMGIAAGKICEMYKKPAILLSLKEDNETIVGSARSTESVNIYELLKKSSKYLEKFGGHSQAAGLSLKKKNLEMFRKEIEKYSGEFSIEEETGITADGELSIEMINREFGLELKKLSPFGEGFEKAKFYIKNVKVNSDRIIKNKHHIMEIENGSETIQATKWGIEAGENLSGKYLNVIGSVSYSETKGIKLEVDDFDIGDSGDKVSLKWIDLRNELTSVEISTGNTLVIESIPPSIEMLKRIVSNSQASEIVIAFEKEILDINTLIQKYIGIIKGNEDVTIAQISSALSISDELSELILEFLAAGGVIQVNKSDKGITAVKGTGIREKEYEKYKRAVLELYNEETGFKNYMKNSSLEEIKEIVEK